MTAAGWYPLDNDPSKILYFDGEKWVGTPVPNPNALPQQPKSFNSLQNTPINYGGSEESYENNLSSGLVSSQQSGTKAISKVVALVRLSPLLIISIAFMFVGFSVIPSVLTPKSQATNEVATTVIVSSAPTDYDGYCSPQVKYSADATETYPLKTNVKSKPCAYSVGEQIDVYYIEGVPESVRPASSAGMSSTFPLIFGGLGVFLGITLILGIIKILRTKYE